MPLGMRVCPRVSECVRVSVSECISCLHSVYVCVYVCMCACVFSVCSVCCADMAVGANDKQQYAPRVCVVFV